MDVDTVMDVSTQNLVAANGAGTSNVQQPAVQTITADDAAQRFQALLVNATPAEREAMLAAAQAQVVRNREQQERDAAVAQYQQLLAQADALRTRWNIQCDNEVSASSSRDALLEVLLQRYVQLETRQNVGGSGEGNAGSGSSKASLAKSMNRPKLWEGSNGGERRAVIFLREVQAWAELHGVRGEDILQNYLGDKVKAIFVKQLDAWRSEGVEVTWDRMCSTFCTIVGETEEDDTSKALDELSGLKVRQKRNQSLGEFKVHFQHEMLRAGGGVPDGLAVRWFLFGLGCKELRSACQPDLTAGKLRTVDDAYLCAKGQEAKLAAVGIRPFHLAHQHAASQSSGAVASLQGKPVQGGNKHRGGQVAKRPHTQAFTKPFASSNKKSRTLPDLPPGFFYNAQGYPVHANNVARCSRCLGTKEAPANDCTKRFHHALPAPPRV